MPLIEQQIKLSNQRFLNFVWPIVKPWIGGGTVVPVEAVTNPRFAEVELDAYGSIDLWHVLQARHKIRGLASRVQSLKTVVYETFTLRDSGLFSEFERLVTSIDGHFLYPELFVQSYMIPGEETLAYAAVVRTSQLVKYAQDHPNKKRNTQDGKQFRCVYIRDLECAGIKVKYTPRIPGIEYR
jgi:hypothetical protein